MQLMADVSFSCGNLVALTVLICRHAKSARDDVQKMLDSVH